MFQTDINDGVFERVLFYRVVDKTTMLSSAKSASVEDISDYGYLMADGHSREFMWGKKSASVSQSDSVTVRCKVQSGLKTSAVYMQPFAAWSTSRNTAWAPTANVKCLMIVSNAVASRAIVACNYCMQYAAGFPTYCT